MIKTILKITAIVWMVVCTGFMVVMAFNWAVTSELKNAVAQGRDQMLESVITATKSCKPIELHGKTEKVTLANLGCPAAGMENK